jgi:hypothetical protein
MSRLAGMRQGYENYDAFRSIAKRTEESIPRNHDINTQRGRGDALDALYASRRVGSMSETIAQTVGGQMSNQELADAKFLLERMARR